MTNDEILQKLTERIDELLMKLDNSVDRYHKTREGLMDRDVSIDKEYQANYTQFYKLYPKRPKAQHADWSAHYFTLLEQLKYNIAVDFAEVLTELKTKTGLVQSSFSSKLMATINPHLPVIDRYVRENLGYRPPSGPKAEERFYKAVILYQCVIVRFEDMIQDERFKLLKYRFNKQFPSYIFTDVKILDLLMWQLRKR